MDIKTLESFKLSDAVTFHNQLNPKLFVGQRLLPQVKKQLLIIAKDFTDSLGIQNLNIKDITVSGSNAAYSYTPHSDLDLHIIVDMSNINNDAVYRELFNAKKTIYNDTHNITVHGIPVELYVQDEAEPVKSLGEYSLLHDKWLRFPTKRRANLDQNATKAKYDKLEKLIHLALKSKNLKKILEVLKTIKRYRQAGLEKGGEFSPENLAFKVLRSQGLITKLYALRDKLHSEKLTIETMYQDPVKIQEEKNKLPPKVYHLTYTKNLPDIMQAGLRPQIGDRSSKVEGEHPAVFCFPDIATLEDAMMNWLGDEFDEDEQLALLEIDTRNLTGEFTPNAEYEVAITSMIPPSRIKVLSKDFDTLEEDYDPNGPPPGPETKPTMPKGTVRVDVSDVYDWYKLGQNISNLDRVDPKIFGKGPPSTIMAFGDENIEHKYINALKKLGLDTTDIDPVDPNQPKNMPRQKVDPTFNVDEDSSMQFAAEKTPVISPYAGIKDRQYRGGISEASGYIPSEKEKNDPRFKTALTVDVHPNSIKKNAKAFGFNTSRAGIPPTLKPSGKL